MVARHRLAGRSFRVPDLSPRVLAGAVGALTIAGVVAGCTAAAPPTPRTARVERASVSTGVSAPGSLSAITEQNLGFPKGGRLTSLLVKVGDRVEPGQPLASVDDFEARRALAAQQAQLQSQQAVLDELVDSPAVGGAQDSLDQAQRIADAVRTQADATVKADEVAIDNARRQLDVDEHAQDQARDARNRACSSPESAPDQAAATSTGSGTGTGTAAATEGSPSGSTGLLPMSQGLARTARTSDPTACGAAQQAYTAAKQKVVADQGAVDSAVQKRDVDKAAGDVSVQNAEQGVVTARNTLATAGSDRPHAIDQQQALVAAARSQVESAQRDLDDTTLRSPVGGTVSVLNGTVGEFVAPSSGVGALAPGTDATIPGAGGGTTAGSAAAAGAASPTRPGGTQFLVLTDVNRFQVVVPFNESDAASIAPNQRVDVTFDAIPDLTMPGTVVAVAPTGTAIAGVISYYVTVALTGVDPRLRAGQTATAQVVTSETPPVLTVPTQAVRTQDGQSEVTVVDGGDPRTVPFQPGVVGADRTEVVSGLRDGQQVLLPVGQ
ncbi:HlyD family efflux transporter periplasmic adaptor subunit [Pseudonocardia sp. RS11V-5]|uniref:HlyD family efflux transporter periplasmic adaptor subunit n=1 Tax=Pseudonocardia terrae TaxID=2905831 RepID=UPI001E5D4C6A|nr:HlyD family efflux transporter periplasmic adaptor subunit [Pseudonocardia terrae]MCE3554195.1 HlyD family efflux transporter periplasmic adaptor subunit [Pseudonocardia terrae]